jgi:soluble lytic murein transglycosylase-like protein
VKLQVFFTVTLLLSCSENSTGKNTLSRTVFTTPHKKIIKIYRGKKLNYREHFILASALKAEKKHLESVFHYLNSCYMEAPFNKKLKLFRSEISHYFDTKRKRSDLFDDAAYEIADITYKYGKYNDTVKILKMLKEKKSGLHLNAILLRAETYKKLDMPEKGIALLKKTLNLYSDISAESFLRIRIASIYEKIENWPSAFIEYLKVIELNDESWQAKAASRRISRIVKSKEIKPAGRRDLYLTSKAFFINREYGRSLSLSGKGRYSGKKEFLILTIKNLCRTGKRKKLSSLFTKNKDNGIVLELKKTAASEYWQMKKRKISIALYSEIAASGTGPYKKDALKKIARYYSGRNIHLGSRFITRFYTSYPDDPLSGKLLWLRGKSELKKKNFQKVLYYLKKSLETSPEGNYSDNCRFWLYKIYNMQKKMRKASDILRELVLKNPDSSYTTLLFKRIINDFSIPDCEKSFRNPKTGFEKSQRLFFHSILTFKDPDAAKKKKRLDTLQSNEIEKYKKTYRDIIEFNIKPPCRKRLKNLERYFRAGYNRGIKREISRLSKENIDPECLSLALSHFGTKYMNYYYSAYYALLTLKQRKLKVNPFIMPLNLLKLIYPEPFKKCTGRISRKYRIEKNLLLSLIRAESFYRHDAVSRSGAVGLMQLLPSTAREFARKLKLKDYTLRDPCTSLEIGSRYINWLKNYVGNSRTKVLAAYNAGPGRVRSWKSWMKKNTDPDYRIEFIPYDETRSYVLKINKYMEHYRMTYCR